MSICSTIKGLCAGKGITINQLEKETGVGRGSIARWDTNSPSIKKVLPVAEYFGVSVDFLLTGYEQKEKPPIGGELSEQEVHLISLFRLVPEDRQEALLQTIEFSLRSQGLL